MKLLWVFSTFAVGGPQRRFATLASALGPGFEHLITAMDGDYAAESLLGPDGNWRRAPVAVKKGGFVSLANLKTFRSLIEAEMPDLLLTSNWGAAEWHLANRGLVPHIHFEDGFGPDEALGRRNWKRDLARRVFFSVGGANAFVAPSTGIRDLFTRAWGVPAAGVHLVPNGADCARFAAAARATRDRTTLGAVGALRAEKRFDRLIRVLAAAGEGIDLLIVGDGPERGALEELTATLGVASRVTFAGAQGDVAPYLQQMDIYAVTSDTEQMPISLVEAMAAGLPVVAADVGDLKRMIADDNAGLVFPRDDEAGFAAAVRALADDPARRASIGAANTKKARADYSLDAMLAAYRELIHDVAKR